jgi:two-component system sensor histidine kinase BaeS
VPLPASQAAGRLYAAQPIMGAAGAIGVLELSSDTAADARLMAALRRLALQAALVAAAASALVGMLVARSIARPILRLAGRAEALAATLDDGPAAEAGALARSPGRKHEIAALDASLARLDAGLRAYTARIAELEQARARFYRGVSHELRTPLTAIRAGLENLADGAPSAARPSIAMLEGEAARLSRLVDELLAGGARAADGAFALGARALLDLSALAAEVCALLAGRAERAGVALSAAGAPLELRGDRDRVKQALINLVDNALRVTPPGGAVLVATVRAGERARLAVMDGGPGVPPELRERIWEPGVRGGDDATDGGAGLGLAIVREIASAHGGTAYLDERYGPGARFVIELPLEERSDP